MGDKRPRTPFIKAGFTIVEVVVSVALMGIIFSAAFGSYFLGMRLIEDARHRLRASQIIQSELERIRTLNWTAIEALPIDSSFVPTGEYVAQFAQFYSTNRAVDLVSSPNQAIIKIDVTWDNSRGATAEESFTTVLTKGGLSDYLYSVPPGGN
jgi:prepilin-type N-terminal cleavage/methylation domain-containing protein